jgi:pyruvate dehydrogenase E2 component (dihydrolipoamide acetyltransferase)
VAGNIIDVRIPDIGGAEGVTVIEVNVSVGDQIAVEDTLLTLESDKATMDVPSPQAGTVKSITVNLNDKVSEGDIVLQLEAGADATEESTSTESSAATETKAATAEPAAAKIVDLIIPDIGGAEDVAVIEIEQSVGAEVAAEDTLLTLESDKATMDVPIPYAGKIIEISCKVGDKLSAGDVVGKIETTAAGGSASASQAESKTDAAASIPAATEQNVVVSDAAAGLDWDDDETAIVEPNFYAAVNVYAGPAVRRLARELGVDLTLVKNKTGDKGRITKNDLKAYVKQRLEGGSSSGSGLGVAAASKIDFSKFGETETVELNRIQKLTGSFLHRNWVTVPHVTQFASADITQLEAFRKEKKAEALAQGVKLTPLAFIMKALEAALVKFPRFNSSLDASGDNLILKKYINIGVAVDTPQGLVVAVVRDVNKKGVYQIAGELGEISKKARETGLSPSDMQGGCMTISSLGGIGGTAFTPIVNAPEVAILGVSKASLDPVFNKETKSFEPRLMLPLCLSYDHRVIDGAEGARFSMYLAECLTDLENLIL